MNLDPAVSKVPYEANIDIRDTVNFKEIMKSHGLGPNGGILTCLNLFTTRFDQVMELCKKRSNEIEMICIDTPGQIEVFTWSASGMIITDALASQYPSVMLYVVDTFRVSDPVTFMSNMTYACSIMYKTKLPMLVVFNKTDVVSHEFAQEWMQDFEAFQDALRGSESYSSSLARSLSLVMDEFYRNIKSVGVSSFTGAGFGELLEKLEECGEEYYTTYVPYVEELRKRMEEKEVNVKLKEETELRRKLKQTKGQVAVKDLSEEYESLKEAEEDRLAYEEYKKSRKGMD